MEIKFKAELGELRELLNLLRRIRMHDIEHALQGNGNAVRAAIALDKLRVALEDDKPKANMGAV
jgi:hypothetical protein